MSAAAAFEAFLVLLYTDESARGRFLADPRGEALAAGLDADQAEKLERIDRVGLELMADSLDHKRRSRVRPR